MYEDLDSLWEELEPNLASRFHLFLPTDVAWDERVVTWDADRGLDEFVGLAESLGVPVLYVSVTRFSDETLSELQRRLLHPAGPHPEAAAILARAETFQDRIAALEIGWMFQGVGHFCEIEAEWYRDLEALIEDEQESDAMALAAERLLLDEQLRLVPEWGNRVAQVTRFQQARSMSQRLEIVPEVVPEIEESTRHYRHGAWIARRLVRDVARRAMQIYEFEMRPAQEKELAREAHELLSTGMKKYEVAARIGISKERLNRLIVRYPVLEVDPDIPSLGEP